MRQRSCLKINVADITNVGAGNCRAGATGGKVFAAKQMDQAAIRIQFGDNNKRMKRIARLGAEPFVADDPPQAHDELVRLLRAHLPPSTVALFAKPKPVAGDLVEWYSDLGGQPLPFGQLPAGDAAQVKRLLDERLDSIQQLAVKLETQGADGQQQANLLRRAARYPDTTTLFSLNGQPVLTFWAHDLRGAAPLVAATPASAAATAANAVNATATNAMGDVNLPPVPPTEPPGPPPIGPAPRKRRGWLLLLLALLLLALLAGLLWWLFCRDEEPPSSPVEPPAVEQPQPEKPSPEEPKLEEPKPDLLKPEPPQETPPVVEQPAPEPPPPEPLDELAKKIKATRECADLEKLLKEEPLLQGTEPRAKALKQGIRTNLDSRCKKEAAQQQQAKQSQIQQAKNQCPGQRPKELAPELAIVVDASGSMQKRLPLTAQQQIQRQVTKEVIGGLGGLIGGNAGRAVGRSVEQATIGDPPTRMSAAKEAAVTVVRRTPGDTSIGLVKIENCPSAIAAGFYAPSQRGSLVGLLQSLQPRGGTPLGDGIAKAGQMLDGVNRASVMVVISDGQESCGKDPCAVARQLAATKPNLKINVVDIMGTGAGNCVAQATGGRVFTAKSVQDLKLMVTQAAQDVLGPGNCP